MTPCEINFGLNLINPMGHSIFFKIHEVLGSLNFFQNCGKGGNNLFYSKIHMNPCDFNFGLKLGVE